MDTDDLYNEDSKEFSYDFDFYALRKLRTQQKRKITVLSIIIVVLLVLLVTFVLLYTKLNSSSSDNNEKTNSGKITSGRIDCESNLDCGNNSYCWYKKGSTFCACAEGHIKNGTHCKESKENNTKLTCKSDEDCSMNAFCRYKNGTSFCACAPGYILNDEKKHCRESKENNTKLTCKSDEDCSMNAFCRYKNGTSFCACATGFILDDEKKHCRESKENNTNLTCSSDEDCSMNAFCRYKNGTSFCACATGFILDDEKKHCRESKENNTNLTCSSDEDCSMNAFCRYKNGTSFCACATGFILDDEKKHCRESKENNTKLTCKSDEDCFMNAFCRYKNGTSFCACATGFILDDQKRHCRDIAFAINFKQRTIRNIPTLYNVIFPETDSVSVCFWYKLRQSPGWVFKRVVSYTIKGKKDFMVWFLEGIMSVISFNNTVRMRRSFVVNRWTQSCWSGRNGGKWTLYVNGKVFSQGTKPRTRKHLTSVGTLYLGQDHDNPKVYNRGRMFEGKITELFIYSGELSKQDVLNSYNHKPRLNDVIVGWWQFKNKTSGKQIVEEHSPFFKEYVTSNQCKSVYCVVNAECQTDRFGNEKCNCKEGYVGNGNDTCKDIAFGIYFKQRTIRNIPTLHNVTFPETDSASVCFWYKLRRSPGWGYKGVVSYTIKGREDFMVWFHTGKMTVISFNNTVRTRRNFVVNRWKHFCWSGRNGGKWTLYIDGEVFSQGTKPRTRKHLTSVGTLYLGQDHDNHKVDDPYQMFEGKITELFIYSGELSKQDVLDSYNHKPRLNDVIVGWWQFKNRTSGKQIVEEHSPFFEEYFTSDQCKSIHCVANAECQTDRSGDEKCNCKEGFVGNGNDTCKDIAFAINFKQRTIRNIPTLHNVTFPETDSASVCFWYKLRRLPGWGYKGVVSYTIKGREDFMVWFHTGEMTVIYFNNTVSTRRRFLVNRWKHFCWSGSNGGKWTLYIDGKVFNQGTKSRTRKHLTSVGTLYLGQDHDNHKVDDPDQMFEGKITELFIYNGELSKQDVLDSYNHKPRLNDVIVGWWQFKNKTSGNQIVEEKSPFLR